MYTKLPEFHSVLSWFEFHHTVFNPYGIWMNQILLLPGVHLQSHPPAADHCESGLIIVDLQKSLQAPPAHLAHKTWAEEHGSYSRKCRFIRKPAKLTSCGSTTPTECFGSFRANLWLAPIPAAPPPTTSNRKCCPETRIWASINDSTSAESLVESPRLNLELNIEWPLS